jgi:hypothetical protein
MTNEVKAFSELLANYFRLSYVSLLGTAHLGATLDRIRECYRNPACHASRTFGPGECSRFARLVVGRDRFGEWSTGGADLDEPPGSSGLLHHLLTGSLLLRDGPEHSPIPSPLERLLALARPQGSRLTVRVQPRLASAAVHSDLGGAAPRLSRPFRLGDSICFAFQADQDCEVALLDVGTSEAVSVLVPNAQQARLRMKAGEVQRFPCPKLHDLALELGGPPGRERVVALAWLPGAPPPLRQAGEDFRILSAAEIAGLCDAVEQLSPDRCAACVCEFEIVS